MLDYELQYKNAQSHIHKLGPYKHFVDKQPQPQSISMSGRAGRKQSEHHFQKLDLYIVYTTKLGVSNVLVRIPIHKSIEYSFWQI